MEFDGDNSPLCWAFFMAMLISVLMLIWYWLPEPVRNWLLSNVHLLMHRCPFLRGIVNHLICR